MAVPTIYSKLIEYYEKELAHMDNDYIKKVFASIRLMVSGKSFLTLIFLYLSFTRIHSFISKYITKKPNKQSTLFFLTSLISTNNSYFIYILLC